MSSNHQGTAKVKVSRSTERTTAVSFASVLAVGAIAT